LKSIFKEREVMTGIKVWYGLLTGALMTGVIAVAPVRSVSAVEILDTVAKNPAEIPPPITRSNPTTVTVNLVIKEVIAELAPGKQFWFWCFAEKKGDVVGPCTVPGPMIRVMEGDTVVINLTNDSNNVEPHNIDLHAVIGPGGGAAVTDVEPGETKTLQFKAMRTGAYIYHCAGEGMPWEHVAYGMYGLIMVEPKGGLKNAYKALKNSDEKEGREVKEFYVGQGEWYIKSGVEHHPDMDGYSLDEEKALSERPDYFTFNGHTKALTDPSIHGNTMMVNQGDMVRIFFVNGGPNIGSNFHIIGQIFDKFYPGHYRSVIRNEETAYIPPGSAAIFEFEALVPGQYPLVDHALFRVVKGAEGYLHVNKSKKWPHNIYSPEATGSGH
jgi:nitrite reductase (NO-forming)